MSISVRSRRFFGLVGAVALFSTATQADISLDVNWRPIDIDAAPHMIGLSTKTEAPQFGALLYRGGLVIWSSDANFGGLSALEVSADGMDLLALSDRGQWLEATLNYDANGRLIGINEARMAPFTDKDGVVLAGPVADAESLAIKGDLLYVGFEREDRIDVYRRSPDRPIAFERGLTVFGKDAGIEFNRGVEALAFNEAGALIAIAESGDKRGAFGWIVNDDGAREPFRWRRPSSFSPTAASVVGGDLYVVERAYSPLAGVRARILKTPAADVVAGSEISGTLLAQFNSAQNIDNFEGLSVREDASGRTFIYLVSDDNFSATQKTLLVMFEVIDSAPIELDASL